MSNLFNAEEAKLMSASNDPREVVKLILEEIKEKASMGKWEYTTRNYGFGDGNLYDIEQNYPFKITNVLYTLRDLGFTAKIIITESQLVDIYLLVTWS